MIQKQEAIGKYIFFPIVLVFMDTWQRFTPGQMPGSDISTATILTYISAIKFTVLFVLKLLVTSQGLPYAEILFSCGRISTRGKTGTIPTY